jgi:uncharacterized protein (DUF3820 family)
MLLSIELLLDEITQTSKAMKDDSIIPFGIHKGKALANVPAKYLLWLYHERKCSFELRRYIEENMAVLKEEIEREKK